MKALSRSPIEHAVRVRCRMAAASLVALLGAGCASQSIDAQWADPQFSGRSLVGAKVFVICQAYDLAVRRVCADQLASELVANGATPVVAPDTADSGSALPATDTYLGAARGAGATAILRANVSAELTARDSGSSVGFGIGGFSGGWGRSTSVGVGVGVPIGNSAGASNTVYSANGAITDVSSGRLMWTAKATSDTSASVDRQMGSIAKSVLGAARKSGLF